MVAHRYDNGNGKKQRKREFSSFSSEIQIKPLSVNRAYTGRKRKSVWLKQFVRDTLKQLPKGSVPDTGNLSLTITFGVSNRAADLDNHLKPFIDILQTAYGFNDKQIYYIQTYKKLVRKGDEYIRFRLNRYHGNIDERRK